jgi:hypothetical protein
MAAQAQVDAMQAQIDALLADAAVAAAAAATAAAAAAAGNPPPPPPPGPLPFVLAPAHSTQTYVALTTGEGKKHFKGGSEPLNAKAFDFTDTSDLQLFLDLLMKKSQVWGWQAIFSIPVTIGTTTTTHNLLKEFGVIPMEAIRDHVLTYYATQTKAAQDSFVSCQCLLGSISLDFLKTLAVDAHQYHLPAINAVGDLGSGPLLVKLIISKAHVDSRSTISYIRKALTELDTKMVELDSNVEEFNLYVNQQVRDLSSRGQTSSDLLVNLFKGYKSASDDKFFDYINRKESDYDEGGDVTETSLMAGALVKYKARKLTQSWGKPTKEQNQILALTAQLEKMSSKKGPNPPAKKKDSNKENKWAWKNVQPKEGEPRTKTFEGKEYHCNCKFHPGKWVCHTTEECFSNPANARSTVPKKTQPTESKGKRLAKAKLAAAAIEAEESASDTSEQEGGDDY